MTDPDFNWQIDDDESTEPWEYVPHAPPKVTMPAARPAGRGAQRKRLVLLLGVVLIAGAGMYAAFNALQARAREQERAASAAVLGVARLEDRLLASGDAEAYATLQDPDASGWKAWQSLAIRQGGSPPLFGFGFGFGGGRRPAGPAGPGRSAVQLAPSGTPTYGPVQLDGDRAQLTVTRQYEERSSQPNGSGTLLTLQQVQYYRLADDRWLHTAPPGDPSAQVVHVTLSFNNQPALEVEVALADQATLQPLNDRLAEVAARTCNILGCAGRLPRLRIVDDPALLTNYRGCSDPQRDPSAIAACVPSPRLVGTPVPGGEMDGMDLYYQAYSLRLMQAIARRRG